MSSEKPFSPLTGLRELVIEIFDVKDLYGLAQDFNLDYDDFKGDNKGHGVVNFIEIVVRKGTIAEFIERCQQLRPRADFQPYLEAARYDPQSFKLDYEPAATPAINPSKLLEHAMRLLEIQSLQKDQQINSGEHMQQRSFSKQALSEPMKADFNPVSRRNETWASKTSEAFNPARSQTKTGDSIYETEHGKSAVIERMSHDIARLEANLNTLGKMESILEDVRERIGYLLEGIREEKYELKNKVKDQNQMIQDEMIKVDRELSDIQEHQKVKSSVPRIAMEPRPAAPAPSRGWKRTEHAYKPN